MPGYWLTSDDGAQRSDRMIIFSSGVVRARVILVEKHTLSKWVTYSNTIASPARWQPLHCGGGGGGLPGGGGGGLAPGAWLR